MVIKGKFVFHKSGKLRCWDTLYIIYADSGIEQITDPKS